MKAPLIALKEIVASRGGGTPSKKVAGYWDGDIPWATVKDFKGLKLSETQDSISSNGLKHSSANLIPKGHVIIPTRMALGKAAINTIDLAINQDLRALIPKRKIHTEYLLYAILGLAEEIEKRGSGATVKGITQENLLNLKIPFPKLEDQIRIAILLSSVEALITKRKDNLRLLDEFLKSTFLEMFGDPVHNGKGWDTIPFPKIGRFSSGGTPSKERGDFWDGAFPWVSPKDMKVSYLANAQDHISEKVFEQTSLKRIKPGHLLIVVRGMILSHSFPTAINTVPVAINQDMKAIYPIDTIKVQYLMACLDAMKRQVLTLISSAGHGTKKFDTLAMNKVFVPAPPVDLQNKFVSIVKKLEVLKTTYQNNLKELENLYATLSQKAFKGELDLNRIPLPKITANGHITMPRISIQGKAVTDKAMSHPLARETMLRRIFANFVASKKGSSFSLEEFWPFVEEMVLDHTDEDSPPLGIADYDQVKLLLFDLLESGGIDQRFNEASNRLELSVSP